MVILACLIKGELVFFFSQMVVNSVLAVFLATPEVFMITEYTDAVSQK